jgi:membrane associated rhomboid family serine protease
VRAPPPLTRLPAYPVTGGVGLIAAAVTVLIALGRWDLARFEMSPAVFAGQPWRVLTSALPHLLDVARFDIFHLPFNLFWLWLFGTLIEDVWGHLRTLALVVVLAAGSALAEYALFRGGVGLSGVTYGLFGLLWVLAPRDKRFAGAVDANTTRLMVIWFFLCIAATLARVWAIANVAHGVGALLGGLVGFAVAARGARQWAAALAVPATLFAATAGAGPLRPRVNLAHDASGSFQLGYQALEAGRFEEGVKHYRVVVATNPKNAAAWYNLGIAHENLKRWDEALAAYQRSWEVDPLDTRHRAAYLGTCERLGMVAARAGRHADAVRYLEAATKVDGDDAAMWFLLSRSYAELGRDQEAEAARERAVKVAPKERSSPP